MHTAIYCYIYSVLICAVFISGNTWNKEAQFQHENQIDFVETYAEKWAFHQIFKTSIPEYMASIQNHTHHLLREKHNIPLVEEEISIKVPDGREIAFNLTLRNGIFSRTLTPTVKLKDVLEYEGLNVHYSAEFTWENITVQHEYMILRNGKGYKGEIFGIIYNVAYELKAHQNLEEDKAKFDDFIGRCHGKIIIDVQGIPEDKVLVVKEIKNAVLRNYYEIIHGDFESLTRMALEDAFASIVSKPYLPKYIKKGSLSPVKPTGRRTPICESDLGTSKKAEEMPLDINYVDDGYPYLPFIKNEFENRTFYERMKSSMEDYTEDLLFLTMMDLADRGLRKVRVRDRTEDFSMKGASGQQINGSIFHENGWVIGLTDFQKDENSQFVCFADKCKISWSIYLPSNLKYSESHQVKIKENQYNGSAIAHLDAVAFAIRMELNLKHFLAEITEFYLVCRGKVNVEINGETAVSESISGQIKGEITTVVHTKALEIVNVLLAQALKQATNVIKIRGYLPRWNYERDMRSELQHLQSSSWHKMQLLTFQQWRETISRDEFVCKVGELITSKDKEFEMDKQISYEYDYMLPFIINGFQKRLFISQLLPNMDKYMKVLLNEANSILLLRGIKKFILANKKSYSLNQGQSDRDEVVMDFLQCSVQDISPFLEQSMFVDKVLYKNKYIILQSKSTIWRVLTVRCDYAGQLVNQTVKGYIRGEWQDVIYNMEIRVKESSDDKVWSLDGATLETFKLACIGKFEANATPPPGTPWVDDLVHTSFKSIARDALKISEDLLRHAFEDAMLSVSASQFLPVWNYKRRPIPGGKRDNGKVTGLKLCSELTTIRPAVADEKFVPFDEFLTLVKTYGLRSNFQQQNYKWISQLTDIFQNYIHHLHEKTYFNAPLSILPSDAEYKVEGSELVPFNIILRNLDIYGFSNWNIKRTINIFYAKDNDVIIFSTEKYNTVTVGHDIEMYIPDSKPDTRIIGKVKVTVSDLEAIWKLRLNVFTRNLKFEELHSYCAREISVLLSTETNIPNAEWMKDAASEEVKRIVQEEILLDGMELVSDIMNNYISKFITKYYVPDWLNAGKTQTISDISLRNKLLKERKAMNYKDLCRQENLNKLATKNSAYTENIPFIKTEADWRLFHGYQRRLIEELQRGIIHKMNLVADSLKILEMQKYQKVFPSEDSVTVTVESGFIEMLADPMRIIREGYTFEVKGVVIPAILHFSIPLIKFQLNVEAIISGTRKQGLIKGNVTTLSYAHTIHIDLKNLTGENVHLNLENVHLHCIGDFHLQLEGFTPGDSIAERVNDVALEMLAGPVLDHIEDIIMRGLTLGMVRMAKQDGSLMSYAPRWNYDNKFKPEENIVYKACT